MLEAFAGLCVVERATRKVRKIFFGVVLLAFAAINAAMFILALIINLAQAVF